MSQENQGGLNRGGDFSAAVNTISENKYTNQKKGKAPSLKDE